MESLRVVILVHDIPTPCPLQLPEVSRKYLEDFGSNVFQPYGRTRLNNFVRKTSERSQSIHSCTRQDHSMSFTYW